MAAHENEGFDGAATAGIGVALAAPRSPTASRAVWVGLILVSFAFGKRFHDSLLYESTSSENCLTSCKEALLLTYRSYWQQMIQLYSAFALASWLALFAVVLPFLAKHDASYVM